MKSLMIAFGMGLLLSVSVSFGEAPVDALPATRPVEAGEMFTRLEAVLLEDLHLVDAPLLPASLLLASAAIDRSTLTRGSDPWWSSGAVGPPREPTDPDSPGLSAGSSLETPWEAWEDRNGLQGEWDSLDPTDR